jgi:predicted ester cyclase
MNKAGNNSITGDAASPNNNNETIRQIAKDFFEQIWNQGDESAIDRFISVNTVGNDPQFGTGRESFRTKWREWQNAFPDIHFRIDDVIVEGNQVGAEYWQLSWDCE